MFFKIFFKTVFKIFFYLFLRGKYLRNSLPEFKFIYFGSYYKLNIVVLYPDRIQAYKRSSAEGATRVSWLEIANNVY